MSKEIKDPLFEKIESRIMNNDFVTAEKMLKKYEAELTPSQKDELQRKIMRQQKEKRKNAKKVLRRRKYGVYWDQIFTWTERLLIGFWLILLIIIAPYGKMYYFTTLESWDGPPFQHNFIMECLHLLFFGLAIVYCGAKSLINHWKRNILKKEMIQCKEKGKDDLFDWYARDEKDHAKREKKWLKGLLVFLLCLSIQLIFMVKIFL